MIKLRGIRAPATTAENFPGPDAVSVLRLVLDKTTLPDEAILYWSRDLGLRALDVDWHGTSPAGDVERLALNVGPTPTFWWVTHGGGLRLLYVDRDGFTAEELAACAGAWIHHKDPAAGIEIKVETRHPRGLRNGKTAGTVHETMADTRLAVLGRFHRQGCTDEARDTWLAEQSMVVGGNYPHDACPIDPMHASNNAAPVHAGDVGLYCASCQSRLGDGFRPYGALVGAAPEPDTIYRAAKAYVHWGQASYYFRALAGDIPETLHRRIYSALLKALHGNDPTDEHIRACFSGFSFVRGPGYWLHADTLLACGTRLDRTALGSLSWAKKWQQDEDGAWELKALPDRLTEGINNGNLTGLRPLSPLLGAPIYGVHNVVAPTETGPLCVAPFSVEKRADYLPPSRRMPLKAAWERLEGWFPGLDRNYLTLLHVARGFAESRRGMLPIVYMQGPSGAGKTAVQLIESAMSGDLAKDIGQSKVETVGEAIGEAAASGGHCVINEFSKLHRKNDLLTTILSLGGTWTYRKPYVGMITVPMACYFLLTDTELAPDLAASEQFGRRVVYGRLRVPVEGWDRDGVSPRSYIEQPGALEAVSAVHSWIVDEFFPAGCSGQFQAVAKGLGFPTLEQYFLESEEGRSRRASAIALFNAVCDRDADEAGWVPFKLDAEADPIGVHCRALIYGAGILDVDLDALKKATEPLYGRWHRILPLTGPARLEFKAHGRGWFARFRSDSNESTATNAQLRRNEVEVTKNVVSSADKDLCSKPLKSPKLSRIYLSTTGQDVGAVSGVYSLTLHIDLETRSRVDLSRTGPTKYAQDPSTEVLCAVACLDGQWFELSFADRSYPCPEPIATALATGKIRVLAHNVGFERALWENVLKWPLPAAWDCTMALACANNLPAGLDAAAKVLGLPGKDEEGAKLMRRLCKPDRKTGEFPAINSESVTRLLAYCRRDVEVELALSEHLNSLKGFEPDVFAAHLDINARGIPVDLELCRAATSMVEKLAVDAGQAVAAVTGGALAPTDLTRVAHLKDWLAENGCDVDNLQSGTLEHALRRKGLTDPVRQVLEARLAISRSSVSKMEAMIDGACTDGRVRDCFRYHKASTGRWAGAGFQPQNLPKAAKGVDITAAIAAIRAGDVAALKAAGNGEAEDALVATVRPAIVAGEGKTLAICDYASIESRVALWLAGDEKHLQMYRDGVDLYCAQASIIYGRTITKADKAERQVGKVGVLGPTYGMGAPKMEAYAKGMGIDLAAAGVTAKQVIDGYRKEYASLAAKKTGLWARYERAALRAVEGQGPQKVGPVAFRQEGATLYIDLPSGRSLTYHNARIQTETVEWAGGDPFEADSVWYDDLTKQTPKPVKMWGGSWLENICQAISRDLTAWSLVLCHRAGWPTILHAHDEIVGEVDAANGEAELKRLEGWMLTLPEWAAGLPIAVEGYLSPRYMKL